MLYDTPLVAYTMIEIRENIIVQVTYNIMIIMNINYKGLILNAITPYFKASFL